MSITTHYACIWADKPTVDLLTFCVIIGAENGPGHVVWEAGIVLSHYLVNHRGEDSVHHMLCCCSACLHYALLWVDGIIALAIQC